MRSSDLSSSLPPGARRPGSRRAFWTKQFYLWHWVSSAFALAAMLFFGITGITLNHAASFDARPDVRQTHATLSPALLATIAAADESPVETRRPLPVDLRRWLSRQLDIDPGARPVEWSEDEIYIDLPRPGGDSWLTIQRDTGAVLLEVTRRGAIAWLNDLHKGRHTGAAWIVFMDFFSVVSVIFCLTGLALLFVHARRRPMTWPVVFTGILLPIFLIIFLVHT